MRISNEAKAQIPAQVVVRCKQRLVALTEVFDADLALCLSAGDDGWSLVAWEGRLAEGDWHERLPYRILESSLKAQKGVLGVDFLGEEMEQRSLPLLPLVSAASALLADNSLLFVAAKRVTKGAFTEDDLSSLERFLSAFESAYRS